MNIIIPKLPHCDRSSPEINSEIVLGQLLEQGHTIRNIFRELKEHMATLDKSFDLFTYDPSLEATDTVLGSLFAMYSALDTAQATYETFRSGPTNGSIHHLTQDVSASPRGYTRTTEAIEIMREFLAQGEVDVQMMKGMLLGRIRNVEGLKATFEHSQASKS
jgi:hypothetical protein